MLSTQRLIELEKEQLNQYAKDYGGARLAEFVAKRTRQYLVQEIIKRLRHEESIDIVRSFEEIG